MCRNKLSVWTFIWQWPLQNPRLNPHLSRSAGARRRAINRTVSYPGWPLSPAPGAGPTKMAPGALTDASMWILMAFWLKNQIILNIADCPFTFQSVCPYPYQVYVFRLLCVTGYDAVLTLKNVLFLFSKGLWLRCLVAIGGHPGGLGPGASRHTVLLQPWVGLPL